MSAYTAEMAYEAARKGAELMDPEWVDPRIEVANKIAVLEATLDQLNADIKAAKKKLTKGEDK